MSEPTDWVDQAPPLPKQAKDQIKRLMKQQQALDAYDRVNPLGAAKGA